MSDTNIAGKQRYNEQIFVKQDIHLFKAIK